LSVPLDRRQLRTWVGDSPIALIGPSGEVWTSSFEASLGQGLSPSAVKVDIRDDLFAVAQRPLDDDGGLAAMIAGFGRYETAAIGELAGRMRVLYGVIAALAVLLVLTVLSIGGISAAEADDADADEGEWREAPLPTPTPRSVADDL